MTLKRMSTILLMLILTGVSLLFAIEMGWMEDKTKVVFPPGTVFYENTQTICVEGYSKNNTNDRVYEVAVLLWTKSGELIAPVFREYPPQKSIFGKCVLNPGTEQQHKYFCIVLVWNFLVIKTLETIYY